MIANKVHALPRWLAWVQQHLFLSFLLLAEAYLLGDLMQRGWVANIEQPSGWGAYHGVGVVLFFAAGAMAAGVALQCSVKAAVCFQTRHPLLGLFNLLGVSVFAGAEIWASLSEHSANLRPSPADQAVLALLNVRGLPLSPTVVVVALLLPFATLYYGFSQQEPPQESAEDREARQARELAEAEHKARLRTARVVGLAGAARAAVQAATQDHMAAQSTDNESANLVQEEEGTADNGTDEGEPEPRPLRARERGRSAAPAGLMSAPEFRSVLARSGVFITPEKARGIVQTEAQHQQIGTTLYASKRALNARAKRMINEAHPTISLVS